MLAGLKSASDEIARLVRAHLPLSANQKTPFRVFFLVHKKIAELYSAIFLSTFFNQAVFFLTLRKLNLPVNQIGFCNHIIFVVNRFIIEF